MKYKINISLSKVLYFGIFKIFCSWIGATSPISLVFLCFIGLFYLLDGLTIEKTE